MASHTRFRSKRIGELFDTAIRQGFTVSNKGSGHPALGCPCCGKATILSKTQGDGDNRRYLNVESRLRQHGLSVKGKAKKGCQYG